MPVAEPVCFSATKLCAHCGVDARLFVEELQSKQNKVKLKASAQASHRAATNPRAPSSITSHTSDPFCPIR